MDIRKKLWVLLLLATTVAAQAQIRVEEYVFAVRGNDTLSLLAYIPEKLEQPAPCIMFVFGGGFTMGSKTGSKNVAYCRALANMGYVAVAIDYRLGLKDVTHVGISSIKPLQNAIRMAVEDLYAATAYVLAHADDLEIDPHFILASGSSAGAITALQADYWLANRTAETKVLPDTFRYAGIVPFAGAVFSTQGKPRYPEKPAPTFFFHGMDDKLVFYNKLQVFNYGLFGSKSLVKRFEKKKYPYAIMRYRDMGHEIAEVPMTDNLSEIKQFIDQYVLQKKQLRKDMTVKNPDLVRGTIVNSPKELYKKN